MAELHSLLRRQLRRVLSESESPAEAWPRLLEVVDQVYQQFDLDHALLIRSLELSSEELLAAHDGMRGMLRAFPDLFLRLRSDGAVLEQQGAEGAPCWQRLIGKRIQDVPVVGLAARFVSALAEVEATGSVACFEFAIPAADAEVYCEARLVPLPGGDILALIRDISERFLAERQREGALALLRSLVDNMTAGVLIETADRTVFGANALFCAAFGITGGPQEIVGLGRDALAVVLRSAAPDPGNFAQRIEEVAREGQPVSAEDIELSNHRAFERDYAPIVAADGQLNGHMWQYRDVTERRSLQSQLEQSQKMEAVGRLAGGVAHDFNNLLTSILGLCDLVLGDLEDAAVGSDLSQVRCDLNEIRTETLRAAELTRQLLAFGRKQVLRPRILDLNGLIRSLRRMLDRLIPENVEISTFLDPALGRIRADPGQMEQVIVNVAVNARDAMANGGRLDITTSQVTTHGADICVPPEMPAGTYVRLSLSDSGCGMDEETRQRVFEPFFTTKAIGMGTGLGLSTVYGIVEQSGGFLQVQSRRGEGTTFDIFFPAVKAKPAPAAESRFAFKKCRQILEPLTALVIEDEEVVRRLISTVLSRSGYHVLEADSGGRGLTVAADFPGPIELLICDVVLPDLSGPEVAKILLRQRPALKVVHISGYPNDALNAETAINAAQILSKPFSPSMLLDRIGETMLEA